MKSFFEGFEHEDAELIETLSRVTYELRENRKLLLEQHGVEDEQALMLKLSSGDIPEHPAYEHYLSASILAETRDSIRSELGAFLQEVKPI